MNIRNLAAAAPVMTFGLLVARAQARTPLWDNPPGTAPLSDAKPASFDDGRTDGVRDRTAR